ncbi:hypothetical protein QJS83_00565 [Bdellovibrio sp. 22V]|uniref:hypothetical protein n=1 Tax=Bdellovibrio TaxID=958 RepID=UPI00254274E5|nr:hypothetical protein [Bdellovibrio sp. 22V]WII72357.1 hypothetical protein QJS83_00565 [Bdellovibrio sp. 22V]
MILFSVLAVSVIAAELTFFLIHKKQMSTVRASSATSLVFAVLVSALPISFVGALQAAFFGATFVGMTDKSRMGWKRVFMASLIFGLIFTFLIPLVKGYGGGLGAAAFAACAVVYAMDKFVRKLKTHFAYKEKTQQ